ncbi:MAG: bis(5'-nucleosyl)-tetraphosphatase (symmetrical) YqeK [Spirochaetales bacterium]|nr:bis(5'-nucleosyl)-tetraphosphatase (symmetrical) YqeK [Spirochaetales bacterium]
MGLKKQIKDYLKTHLSPKRYEHSIAVAKLSKKLAKKHGLPAKKAFLAGLLHDAAKELSEKELIKIATQDGLALDSDEKQRPTLLHGRAAAVLAQKNWGINDEMILQGIRDHIFGRPGMEPFSMVIYCADLLEPHRQFIKESLRQKVLSYDLEKMTLWVAEFIFRDLKKKGRRIVQSSLKMYKELKERMNRDV